MSRDEEAAKPCFNLVDEPWIRVRLSSGKTPEMSLLDVFAHASEIETLCNDLPTQDFAILRVLLAILQRALSSDLESEDDPTEVWGRLWNADGLPMELINSYLEYWHGRFDLFDEQCPFMQVAGLHGKGNKFSDVRKIIADVPDRPDRPMFFTMRIGGGLKSLTYPEAARWLVHLQAYDPNGLKPGVEGGSRSTKKAWDNNLGGLYVQGVSLRETLLLNLVLSNGNNWGELFPDDDLPCWERNSSGPVGETRTPKGRADVYTWQSRRVLFREADGLIDGVLLSDGDRLPKEREDQSNCFDLEPMTAWRNPRGVNGGRRATSAVTKFVPMRHQKERALWRGLDSILLGASGQKNGEYFPPGVVLWVSHVTDEVGGGFLDGSRPIRLRAVGYVYGTSGGVYDELIDDTLTLTAFLLSSEGQDADELVRECLAETDGAVYALGVFARNLQVAAGDKDKTADGARNEAMRRAYFELDGLFRSWLAGLGPASDLSAERETWRRVVTDTLRKEARELLSQVGPDAHVGHAFKGRSKMTEWMTAARAETMFFARLAKLMPVEHESSEERSGL